MYLRLCIALLFITVVSASKGSCDCPIRCVRKEIRTLSLEEVSNFTSALLQLNQKPGNYFNERYPITHYNFVNNPPIGPNVHDTNFLPWHRYLLRQLEMDLQAINPAICLPYWNWTLDNAMPADSPVFQSNYFGSGANSSENSGECVHNGPFTFENGWHIPQFTPDFEDFCSPNYNLTFDCEAFQGTTCLARNYFGSPIPTTTTTTTPVPTTTPAPTTTSFDTSSTVVPGGGLSAGELIGIPNGHGCIITAPSYLPPYSSVLSLLETNESYMFWSNSVFCTIHNSVHRYIGGQMETLLSPSDPIFYLHHGYLDVIFSQWQALWNVSYSGNTYVDGLLVPVNTTDILFPFGYSDTVPLTQSPITVEAVWNIEDLCYTYEY